MKLSLGAMSLFSASLVLATPSTYVQAIEVEGLGFSQAQCAEVYNENKKGQPGDVAVRTVKLPVPPSYVEAYFKKLLKDTSSKMEVKQFVVNPKTKQIEKRKEEFFRCDRISAEKIARYVKQNPDCLKHSNDGLEYLGPALTQKVSIHAENDIWLAPDDLSCLPWTFDIKTGVCGEKVNDQLSNLIKRAGVIDNGKRPGSVLILGKNCDKALGAKHMLYTEKGVSHAPKAAVARNYFEYGKELPGGLNKWKIFDVPPGTPYKDREDVTVHNVGTTLKDSRLKDCRKVPTISENKIRKNYRALSCVLVGYNGDSGSPDRSKRSSTVVKTHEGFERVDALTRSITPCTINGFASDGLLKTDCDAINMASGGPLLCKSKGSDEWALAGTVYGDTCTEKNKGADYYNKCLNPAKKATVDSTTFFVPITPQIESEINKAQ